MQTIRIYNTETGEESVYHAKYGVKIISNVLGFAFTDENGKPQCFTLDNNEEITVEEE